MTIKTIFYLFFNYNSVFLFAKPIFCIIDTSVILS